MKPEDEFNILAKLAEIEAAALPATAQVERLREILQRGASPTSEERLAAYRAVRDERLVPPDAAFHLLAWGLMRAADERQQHDARLDTISAKMEAIRKAQGLAEDEFWPPGEGPKEHRRLAKQWETIADALTGETFESNGEREMAELFLKNRSEFDRRFEAGRRFFHPESE